MIGAILVILTILTTAITIMLAIIQRREFRILRAAVRLRNEAAHVIVTSQAGSGHQDGRERQAATRTLSQTEYETWLLKDAHHRRQLRSPAAGLARAAVVLLPSSDRDRYADEYRSELWDLAQSGAGYPQQVLYALRQLLRAVPMRIVLRSPRRRSAAP
jgi:hypothetical protein